MTLEQLHILQHALGVDKYGLGEQYRNHYCAGDDNIGICKELIALGYMQQHETTKWLPYFNCSVTEVGKKAMGAESPKPPKPTRSQIRFEEYRSFSDAYDCTFKEWLQIRKTEWYKRMKDGKSINTLKSIFD
jgi:hypothetical protein